MPARTDHDRRDAQHAARATIAIGVGQYVRRITEMAYAIVEEEATRDHDHDVDWSEVGKAAAYRALASYGVGRAEAALDHADVAALPAGDAAGDTPTDA